METIVATVKNVNLFVGEKDSANVTITVDKAFKGFVKNEDGTFDEHDDVQSFSMSRSKLCYQIYQINEDIALYRATLGHALDQKSLAVLLMNSKIVFNREFHAAGEILEGSETALDRDCYITTITKIELTARATKALDKALDL